MNFWFTSDLHLGSTNIIKYCNRPYSSAAKMASTFIDNWNARVKAEDTVFHIGDFCFTQGKEGREGAKYWEKKLNGKIIHIEGNHDKNNKCKAIIQNAIIRFGGKRILLVHNPEHLPVIINYDFALVGHVHTKWKIVRVFKTLDSVDCINVGVDVWNYRPASFNEIMKRYSNWLKTGKV